MSDGIELVAAQRDGYRRISEEAMKLMTDEQLTELFHRLNGLDWEAAGDRAAVPAT